MRAGRSFPSCPRLCPLFRRFRLFLPRRRGSRWWVCTKGSKEVDLTVDRHDILCFTSCLIANFKGDAN